MYINNEFEWSRAKFDLRITEIISLSHFISRRHNEN